MVAVITSCINPFSPSDSTPRSAIDVNTRLSQTKETIDKLSQLNFTKIYLVDNSSSFDFDAISNTDLLVKRHVSQYQFQNKGINELLLLLYIIDELPENEPIFKISGRYYPNHEFSPEFLDMYDFKIKGYDYSKKIGTVSTRAYFVKEKKLYKNFLLKCLNELYIYSYRIVGLRSALKAMKGIVWPHTPLSPNTSIEVAFAKVLKAEKYKVQLVSTLGIEGEIAGFSPVKKITE